MIYKKDDFSQLDIEMILKNNVEESVYLEFKSAGSLQNSDRSKAEISKDVSAFANSDGGLLIYGIKEVDHKADSIDFINGRLVTKEWIENVIDSNVKRSIADIKIFPIRFDSDLEKTIYVIKIPASQLGPHMANDNRFYRRANYKNLPMEEYEIRNHYSRRLGTKLIIDDIIVISYGASLTGEKIKSINYQFSIQIKNIGQTIEKNYKIEAHIPEILYHNWNLGLNPLDKYKIRTENKFIIFSIPNTSPIFQNEVTTLFTFPLQINRSNYPIINKYGIKLKLYYSSGIEESIQRVTDKFDFNRGILDIDDFE